MYDSWTSSHLFKVHNFLGPIWLRFTIPSSTYPEGITFTFFQTPLTTAERTRPELQFRASKEEAIYFLINSISLLRLPFIQALALWNSEDLMSLVDVVLNFTPPR
jgi:hypothetical protein